MFVPKKCSRALKEVLYPGNSGYYAQTGGNLFNLRYNTTIDKVELKLVNVYDTPGYNRSAPTTGTSTGRKIFF